MRRGGVVLALALAGLASACVDDVAPGNDREAELDPPAKPAEMASAGSALQGIATALVIPQALTEADLGAIPGMPNRCLYRYTTVGLPAAVYDETTAVLKLNDKLVPLAATGDGRYGAAGVDVTLRPLEGESRRDGPFEAELVLRLADAPDELGYHGYAECRSPGT